MNACGGIYIIAVIANRSANIITDLQAINVFEVKNLNPDTVYFTLSNY